MPEELFTIDTLKTYGGMLLAVTITVQFIKGFFKDNGAPDWVVRLIAFGVSLLVQAYVLYVTGNVNVEASGLAILNAVLVTLASIGTYETIADPLAVKKKPPTKDK